ncbi:hypothetical protein [Bradyrhizobium japonicum]|uniref:hypothetical protein n=1 Tax=Bradyrhizobium japonicum TaxID=375 RepID=UPI002714B0E6|nr:hypothetical protein [Bradyrhizobium japonicum]WLB19362.1 hypothetical protein QIH95_46935 [Bradyrhizobium japonicum]
MPSMIENRLSKLEQARGPVRTSSVHRVIGDSESECLAMIESLVASGRAIESDFFISRVIISPIGLSHDAAA